MKKILLILSLISSSFFYSNGQVLSFMKNADTLQTNLAPNNMPVKAKMVVQNYTSLDTGFLEWRIACTSILLSTWGNTPVGDCDSSYQSWNHIGNWHSKTIYPFDSCELYSEITRPINSQTGCFWVKLEYKEQGSNFTNTVNLIHTSFSTKSNCTVCAPLGNKDVVLREEIKIFPNPVQDNFTVQLDTKFNQVLLTNSLGILVGSYSNSNTKQVDINTSNFSSGLYFVSVVNDRNQLLGVKKIIIE